MVLQRWYPFAGTRRMEKAMDRLWRGFNGWEYVYPHAFNRSVPLDVEEKDDSILVRASLPSVRPEDIEVTTEDGVLTIKAESTHEEETREGNYLMRERRTGSFHRSIRLPDTLDADKADSSYEHGVLTISFPKQEAKKAKRLEVKVTS